ncbi:MAG: ferrous iron transporter B [candidate division NC10 bacterium]|nr:ferrous iron transporter B [candidate division NC10 bacterium]
MREKRERGKILLLGNPQVGKTALWSELSEGNRYSFHPEGEMVEVRRSLTTVGGEGFELIDPPGVQSLTLDTEEASLTRRILLKERPSILLLVFDAKNLRRGLMLFLEAMESGLPMAIAINMSDEARQRGISIDPRSLSDLLGVPACLTSAPEGEGISALRSALANARPPSPLPIYPDAIQQALEELAENWKEDPLARFQSLLFLAGYPEAGRFPSSLRERDDWEILERRRRQIQTQFRLPLSVVMAEARLRRADDLAQEMIRTRTSRRVPFVERIDGWLRMPATGLLAFALILCLFYLFVGRFGAGTLGRVSGDLLFGRVVIPFLAHLLRPLHSFFLEEMLLGPFGLVSMGLASALGLILPVLGTFFFFLAFLEDSGYISRLGVLSHRIFKRVGLHGKAVLTIFLGFSCVTMAVLASRFLDSKKERLIATFLLGLGIPCSAQLSVIFALSSAIPISAYLFVFSVLLAIELGMGTLANRVVPGVGSDFLMEIFPLRLPHLKDLLLKTYFRLLWFLREAIPLFLLGTFLLFLCDQIGLLHSLERLARPVVTGLFGLPPEATEAFMMGFLRKEMSVPILKNLADAGRLNHVQIVISLVLTTLFIPCVSTLLVVLKHQGLRATLYITTAILLSCLVAGGTLNYLLTLLRVTF